MACVPVAALFFWTTEPVGWWTTPDRTKHDLIDMSSVNQPRGLCASCHVVYLFIYITEHVMYTCKESTRHQSRDVREEEGGHL